MPVLLSDMTQDILKSAKVDSDGSMYLDDFLGNNDLDLFNRSKVSAHFAYHFCHIILTATEFGLESRTVYLFRFYCCKSSKISKKKMHR